MDIWGEIFRYMDLYSFKAFLCSHKSIYAIFGNRKENKLLCNHYCANRLKKRFNLSEVVIRFVTVNNLSLFKDRNSNPLYNFFIPKGPIPPNP